MTLRVGVLASGRGTDLQSLIDAQESGRLGAQIVVVISNVEDAYTLERAKKHSIPAVCIPHKGKTREEHETEIIRCLKEHGVELVVLAGYIRMLTSLIVNEFRNRMLNIHPALLPSFGGEGWYGEKVHQGVLEAGCKVSGCTVHFVTEGVDRGPIILQKAVEVRENDRPETLAARILVEEHGLLPEAVRLFAEGKLKVEGKRVRILGRD